MYMKFDSFSDALRSAPPGRRAAHVPLTRRSRAAGGIRSFDSHVSQRRRGVEEAGGRRRAAVAHAEAGASHVAGGALRARRLARASHGEGDNAARHLFRQA